MRLIVRLIIDETDRYDLKWKDESFIGFITSILKNPHGYDEVEKTELTFDNRERKLKLVKDKKTIEVNMKTRKEINEDNSVLIAEIWPIRVAEPI